MCRDIQARWEFLGLRWSELLAHARHLAEEGPSTARLDSTHWLPELCMEFPGIFGGSSQVNGHSIYVTFVFCTEAYPVVMRPEAA